MAMLSSEALVGAVPEQTPSDFGNGVPKSRLRGMASRGIRNKEACPATGDAVTPHPVDTLTPRETPTQEDRAD